ncbi:MAG: cell division topological specificity factor MinE [Dethiobacter sp.]|jgi:cell division topological specificity factor|nr:cell division topological specificity factor MinE [Dethiobacter sp.]MBS3899558.1 cell division topological specificity factor MinE [Dethiobacter sp.]MBS3983272.1 cell division topological specificity factor MinE [Dethiobacter sp.]MCL4463061.1 cell division topological specificity factor MinE [Bacillota bacterium]MCL5994328.1 cell division topological specificity factor MinE [Bacillota bacterium]
MNLRALLNALAGKQDSKDIAKERLRLVLVHDRTSVSPEFMEQIKEEIIKVISKYMEIDTANTVINLHKTEGTAVLEANLAIKAIRRPG